MFSEKVLLNHIEAQTKKNDEISDLITENTKVLAEATTQLKYGEQRMQEHTRRLDKHSERLDAHETSISRNAIMTDKLIFRWRLTLGTLWAGLLTIWGIIAKFGDDIVRWLK